MLAGLLSLVNAVTSLVLASQGAAKINHSSNQPPYAVILIGIVIGLIGAVAAYGVFRAQRWGVVLTLVLMVVNVIFSLPGIAFGPTVFDKVGAAGTVAVAGAVIYFLLRRDRAVESKVEQDDDSVFAAMRAGARGYVLKDMDADDFARAIVTVGRGEALFSRGIAARMMQFFSEPHPSTRPFPDLTDSERNVLRLVATGSNNAAIARKLSLSPKTVRNYISNIFRKLQVADRAQAIIIARTAGLEQQ